MHVRAWLLGLVLLGCIDRTSTDDPPPARDLDSAPPDARIADATHAADATLDATSMDATPMDALPPDLAVDPPDMAPDAARPLTPVGPCTDPLCTTGCLAEPTGDCLLPHDGVQWIPVASAGPTDTGTIDLATLFRVRQRHEPLDAVFALDLPPLDDFRVEVALTVDWPADSTDALGYFGLQWADEVPGGGYPGTVAGMYLFEGRPLRLDYRGRTALGFGTAMQGTQRIFIERVGGHLRTGTWQTADSAWVPAPYMPELETPPTLVRLLAACVDCRLTVESLTVHRPWRAPDPPWRACDNLLRNADFRQVTDSAPDHWRLRPGYDGPRGWSIPDAWRAHFAAVGMTDEGLALPEPAARAPYVWLEQPVELPPGCHDPVLQIEADGPMLPSLDTTPTDACPCTLDQIGPQTWVFSQCQGGPTSVRLVSVQSNRIRFAQLSLAPDAERCVAWPDQARSPQMPRWRAPIIDGRAPLRSPDGRATMWSIEVLNDATGDVVVDLPAGLPGRFDVIWRPTLGVRPQRIRGAPSRVLLPTLGGPTAPGLQVVYTTSDGQIASLAPTVSPDLDNPLAFARLKVPQRPADPVDARPFPAIEPVQLALVPRRVEGVPFQGHHLELLAGLGVDGVSVSNPPLGQLADLFAAAAERGGLAIESNMFQYDAFWRDAGDATYTRWAQDVAEAAAACPACRASVSFVDEPFIGALRACIADLASGVPEDARPALANACNGVDCPAEVRCRESFPPLLRGLAERLRAALPEAVTLIANFTLDRTVDLGDAARSSWTNNWIGRAVPARWSPILSARLAEGTFAGYTPIASGGTGWRPKRAPSAREHRGMAAWLAAAGVEALRLFIWPPSSSELVAAIGDVRVFHRQHVPTLVGARRVATSHRAVQAWRTADRLLIINSTARRHTVRVDDADALLDGERIWGDGALRAIDDAVYADLQPFAALLAARR